MFVFTLSDLVGFIALIIAVILIVGILIYLGVITLSSKIQRKLWEQHATESTPSDTDTETDTITDYEQPKTAVRSAAKTVLIGHIPFNQEDSDDT